ncbi:MAG TPA: helix-turn-helix domain-containing protein [Phycisphaerae bacterium]|nr:helix-turn-helix domain-containing protein [Phycisphaerae bacterium]
MLFICPDCYRIYGDPLYHGPAGHAPPLVCFDCWASRWAWTEMLLREERGDWTRLDAALFFICHGLSRDETARRLRISRRTLALWIARLRKNPRKTPEWLRDRVAQRTRAAQLSRQLATEGTK